MRLSGIATVDREISNGRTMPISRYIVHVFLLTGLVSFILLVMSCFAHGAKQAKKTKITELELQSDLMVFADNFSIYLYQALREYELAPTMQKMRPVVVKDMVLSSISAFRLAADRDPAKALLDMVAMVSMGRSIYENHWQNRYGDIFLPMVKGYARGEKEIWDLAARLIDEQQQRTFRQLIDDYRARYPEQTVFTNLHFSDLVSDSTVLPLDQKKAGGLFKAVKEATEQVEEARLLAERGLYLAMRVPLLLGNLGDFWMGELAKNQQIRMLSEDIHRFTSAVDQLPATISRERNAAIRQGVQEMNAWSRTTIKQFFSEFNKSRQEFLKNVQTEEKTLSRLMAELRDTLQEGRQLVGSTVELAKMFGALEKNYIAPSMSIDDYRTILADIQVTIRELNLLLATAKETDDLPLLGKVNQMVVSSLGHAGKQGEAIVNLSFTRGMLLILFGVVILLIAQIVFVHIKKRITGKI